MYLSENFNTLPNSFQKTIYISHKLKLSRATQINIIIASATMINLFQNSPIQQFGSRYRDEKAYPLLDSFRVMKQKMLNIFHKSRVLVDNNYMNTQLSCKYNSKHRNVVKKTFFRILCGYGRNHSSKILILIALLQYMSIL